MSIQAIAVFCGSKVGTNPLYETHARQLGALLAKNNISIIYGGSNKGLMGALANASLDNGGKVIGIMPEVLSIQEHLHEGLTETHVVDGMHSRKKLLYEKCDAAIIMPGGYGTLDEVFEMLTWNQLKIHSKKIFFLNTDGFYDHMVAHITHMFDAGFLYNPPSEQMVLIAQPSQMERYLNQD